MRVGVSGHQDREGLDWAWTRSQISEVISVRGPFLEGITALARGSDQVFAEVCLDHGIPITAIIPLPNYDRCFEGAARANYHRLRDMASIIELRDEPDPQQAFLNAGLFVVDHCDLLIAVWDGQPATGSGGTADIVAYARAKGRAFVHLDPIHRKASFHPRT